LIIIMARPDALVDRKLPDSVTGKGATPGGKDQRVHLGSLSSLKGREGLFPLVSAFDGVRVQGSIAVFDGGATSTALDVTRSGSVLVTKREGDSKGPVVESRFLPNPSVIQVNGHAVELFQPVDHVRERRGDDDERLHTDVIGKEITVVRIGGPEGIVFESVDPETVDKSIVEVAETVAPHKEVIRGKEDLTHPRRGIIAFTEKI
jgi:hypothetical protein